MPSKSPFFVALCGAPESGKTTVANLLVKNYGAKLVDDGAGLREGCSAFYGFPLEWCYSQEGKKCEIEVCGEVFTVRKLLGDFGKLLETKHGQQVIPETAIRELMIEPNVPFYVFGSVRMDQGITYHRHGGVVIEVDRPGYVPVHDFDHWDKSLVDYRIKNTSSLLALEARTHTVMDKIFETHNRLGV
jgi:hypothetical protein